MPNNKTPKKAKSNSNHSDNSAHFQSAYSEVSDSKSGGYSELPDSKSGGYSAPGSDSTSRSQSNSSSSSTSKKRGDTIETEENTYKIKKELGKGAFGTVYLAAFKTAQKKELSFAIKVQSFKKEKKLKEAMHEANIAINMGLGKEQYFIKRNGVYEHYVVMEMIPGSELKDVIKNQEKNDDNDSHIKFLSYYLKLINQLEALHKKGFLHCDIKPANMMWGDQGPRLIDFGLTLELKNPEDDVEHYFRGTPKYSAPELQDADTNDKKGIFNSKTDSYGLALSLQEYCEAVFGKKSEYAAFFKRATDSEPKYRLSLHEVKQRISEKLAKRLSQNVDADSTPIEDLGISDVFKNLQIILQKISNNHKMGVFHGNITEKSMILSTDPTQAGLIDYARGFRSTGVKKLDTEEFEKVPPSAFTDLQKFVLAAEQILLQKDIQLGDSFDSLKEMDADELNPEIIAKKLKSVLGKHNLLGLSEESKVIAEPGPGKPLFNLFQAPAVHPDPKKPKKK